MIVPSSLVAADVEIAIGPPIGQPMDEPRVAVEGEDDVLVPGEKGVVLGIAQTMGVFARRLQPHEVDDVDHPDLQIGQMFAKDRDGRQDFQRRRVTAAGHHDVGFLASGRCSPIAKCRVPACSG